MIHAILNNLGIIFLSIACILICWRISSLRNELYAHVEITDKLMGYRVDWLRDSKSRIQAHLMELDDRIKTLENKKVNNECNN